MSLLKKKKKVEKDDTVRLIETLKLFDDEKEVKDVGFYSNTSAERELKRQRRFRAENNDYLGLFGNEDIKSSDFTPTKSVAKTYGTKYVSDGRHQLASSIVVDVRSYKKEEDENKVTSVKASDIWGEPKEKAVPKRSFFDDLLKELDKEDDEKQEDNFDDIMEEENEEVLLPPVPPKKEVKKKPEVKKPVKKKRAIDIDIISGDFGGSDIL